tara:strand:+ start:208 stop:894 length:687 start_codon:yes stop_codon:yes gene_type:complete
MNTTKKCSRCQAEKKFSEFNKCKSGRLGLHNQCRDCQKEYKREWYLKNQQTCLEYNKIPEVKNRAKIRTKKKYDDDSEYRNRILLENKLRRREEPARTAQAKNEKWRRENNLNYRMRQNLNGRLVKALQSNALSARKLASIVELTGCTMSEFVSYIETLWVDGMNWNNYGKRGWHLDHIIPCRKFDLSKLDEQKACYNYTNFQPLWWYDNLKKGSSLPDGKDAKAIIH